MEYNETTGWWVYVIKTPDNMYYPGYSGGKDGNRQPISRWKPSAYQDTTLKPYIEQFGWDILEKVVVKDGLTKEEALYWEDRLICMYQQLGCCINQRRSGGNRWVNGSEEVKQYYQEHKKDRKQSSKQYYQNHKEEEKQRSRQYYQDHKEKRNEYHKKWRSTPEGKIYNRVNNFNHTHPDKMIETPSEAKQKYLEMGYIPDYIKSDDL